MKDFKGKVAVITGAASGIGRALAERAAQEGMKVVLADIEKPVLAQAEQEMKAAGAEVLAVPTDVSKAGDVEALAKWTLDAFGAVHLLCNNAGIGAGTTIWDTSLATWQWMIGVNLWGIIHGIRTFVPIMLQQGTEGHIVNTASHAGLASPHPVCAAYTVTKHAAVALSEELHYSLLRQGARIKASVLCPGWVKTRILESERNRPADLSDPAQGRVVQRDPKIIEAMHRSLDAAMPAVEVAQQVFSAIQEERFYILTHPAWKAEIQARMENILQGRNPVLPQ